MATFRVCYARALGDCSTRLSREHYISRAVLDELPRPYIEGFGRTPDGAYSSTALTAKVLCGAHNTMLSDLDAEAAKTFRILRGLQTALDDGATPSEAHSEEIDGTLLERWFLKLALGLIAAGQLGKRSADISIESVRGGYEQQLIKVAFGLDTWPPLWGLYLNVSQDQAFAAPTTSDGSTAEFAAEPATNPTDNSLWALRVWIRSFPFLLAFGKPGELSQDTYRPGALVIGGPSQKGASVVNFSWGADGYRHVPLNVTRIGTLNNGIIKA